MGFELLDNDLPASTLWMFGSKDAKILFVTALALAHGSEVVRAPEPVLFRLAGLTLEEGRVALEELLAGDPDSKNEEESGARLVRVRDEHGRGLRLPSYRKYRDRYMSRERAARKRQKEKEIADGHAPSRRVTAGHAEFALEAEAEAYTEAEGTSTTPSTSTRRARKRATPTLDEVKAFWTERGLRGEPEDLFQHYENCDWRLSGGRGAPMKDWRLAALRWSRGEARRESARVPGRAEPTCSFCHHRRHGDTCEHNCRECLRVSSSGTA